MILTITAGVAAGVLNLTELKQRIRNLQFALNTETAGRQKAESDLSETRVALTRTSAILRDTQTQLTAAKEERAKALAAVTAEKITSEKVRAELAQTRNKLDDTQAYLERYKAAGMEPEQIVNARELIKTLQKSLAVTQKENGLLNQKLQTLARLDSPGDEFVPLPYGLKANVLVFDPKWHFVVLDAGQNQGVASRGELLLTRQGKLVAKARVTTVQNDRCIANLLPGSELSDVVEGDQAIPAPPHS